MICTLLTTLWWRPWISFLTSQILLGCERMMMSHEDSHTAGHSIRNTRSHSTHNQSSIFKGTPRLITRERWWYLYSLINIKSLKITKTAKKLIIYGSICPNARRYIQIHCRHTSVYRLQCATICVKNLLYLQHCRQPIDKALPPSHRVSIAAKSRNGQKLLLYNYTNIILQIQNDVQKIDKISELLKYFSVARNLNFLNFVYKVSWPMLGDCPQPEEAPPALPSVYIPWLRPKSANCEVPGAHG